MIKGRISYFSCLIRKIKADPRAYLVRIAFSRMPNEPDLLFSCYSTYRKYIMYARKFKGCCKCRSVTQTSLVPSGNVPCVMKSDWITLKSPRNLIGRLQRESLYTLYLSLYKSHNYADNAITVLFASVQPSNRASHT